MRVLSDIVYTERQGSPLALDLYLPEAPAQAVVLHAHGGGFFKGHRRAKRVAPIAQRLADHGLAMASISYRLATPPEAFSKTERWQIHQNRKRSLDAGVRIAKRMLGPAFEAARQDMGSAISFLKGNQTRFDLRSGKVAILGISAGGIAGMSLAYPPRNMPGCARPDAVLTLGATVAQPWELSPDGPPVLMIHSQQDKIIDPVNAAQTLDAARQSGAPVTGLTCQRKGHNAPVLALLKDSDASNIPYWDHMLALLCAAGLLNPLSEDV